MHFLHELKTYLTERPELTGIRIRDSFGGAVKEEPLTGPLMTLGLGGLTVRQAFLEESAPLEADITVRFLLYSPLRTGSGGQCQSMRDALLEALLFQRDFPFSKFACATVEAQRDAGAYALEVLADCRGYFSREEVRRWNR